MIEDTRSCCCPDIADVAGLYTHDPGTIPGQFKKTLTLSEDGTFEYSANFDLGLMISSGRWKLIPQGAKCFVQLASNPEPVNALINVHFDRTLLHLDGSCLRTEATGAASISFCRTASAFPKKA
jgi:hypothetical protein